MHNKHKPTTLSYPIPRIEKDCIRRKTSKIQHSLCVGIITVPYEQQQKHSNDVSHVM